MSAGVGMRNLSGSEATSASRSSFGKANPICVSSRENAKYTIRPTRNFTRSRTSASYERGKLEATARTPSMVAMVLERISPALNVLRSFPRGDASGGSASGEFESAQLHQPGGLPAFVRVGGVASEELDVCLVGEGLAGAAAGVSG